jgi:hypothetical protein
VWITRSSSRKTRTPTERAGIVGQPRTRRMTLAVLRLYRLTICDVDPYRADAMRASPCFGPSTTTTAPIFTRL